MLLKVWGGPGFLYRKKTGKVNSNCFWVRVQGVGVGWEDPGARGLGPGGGGGALGDHTIWGGGGGVATRNTGIYIYICVLFFYGTPHEPWFGELELCFLRF